MKRSAEGTLPAEPRKRQATVTATGALSTAFAFPDHSGISKTIHDRSSIFQAFFLPLTHGALLKSTLSAFKGSHYCDGADHIMMAYRFHDAETGIDAGFDDDGERYAGSKLQGLLHAMDAYGLLLCVRVYGGIMLGPIRFQHIVQCAREAVMVHRHERSRSRVEGDRTRRLLVARDKTIATLREMLAPAETPLFLSSQSSTPERASQSDARSKYETQSQEVLSRLLAARDKTIIALRASLASKKQET